MRRRVLIMIAVLALALVAFAGPAAAGGKSGVGQLHPGHAGFINSGGQNISAPPVNHYGAHNGGAVTYPDGPGGWGETVSATAKACGGLAKAHQGC